MDQSQKEGRAFSISLAVVFLGLIGVVLVRQLPLTPTRPSATGQYEQTLESGEVAARLWQDPFAAVSQYLETRPVRPSAEVSGTVQLPPRDASDSAGGQSASGSPPSIPPTTLKLTITPSSSVAGPRNSGARGLKVAQHTEKSGKLIVLCGMLFGGAYQDVSELRRRWRYAIVSSLAESGYVPENSQHIRYLVGSAVGMPEALPYEWFVSGADPATPPVLLLWLDDNKFAASATPLQDLLNLLADITEANGEATTDQAEQSSNAAVPGNRQGDSQESNTEQANQDAAKPELAIKVLGPAGTTTLTRMVAEIRALKPGSNSKRETGPEEDNGCDTIACYRDKLHQLGGVEFYSATATADNCSLLGRPPGCNDTIAEVFRTFDRGSEAPGKVLKFTRTINSDSELAATLAQELVLRGALSRSVRSHVVLISEWDTDYGRALPTVMERQFRAATGSDNVKVTKFSYLRGLDGQLPNAPRPPADNQGPGSKQGNGSEFEKERPVGTARYDYLRRLVKTIKRMDENEGRRDKVRAIGVLGSDVYDKQLILQALRPVFPNVNFFTTDLDARLLHPTDFRWNRNLIVASGYGLELNHRYQDRIPPFRGDYQTSLFVAGLMALDYPLQLPPCLKPRIFEVGRETAFELTNSVKSPTCPISASANASAVQFYPASPDLFPTAGEWWQTGGLLLAALFFVYYTSSSLKNGLRNLRSSSSHPRLLLLALASGIALAIYLFVHFVGGALRYEPFDFFSGISAWPGILLRVAAFLLAVVFIILGLRSLDRSRKELDAKVHPGPGSAPMQGVPNPERSGRASPLRLDEISVYRWRRDGEENSQSGEQIWLEYSARVEPIWRLMRIATPLLVYMVVVGWILLTSDYHLPVRGVTAPVYTIAISFAAFFAMSLLTFIIEDASRLCRRFIQLLSQPNIHWTRETREAFMQSPHEAIPRDEWVSLQVISERANSVAKLIVYPFAVLFLLIASRLSYFDNWNTPMGIVLIYLTLATYAFVNVFILHRSTRRARDRAIDSLEDQLIKAYQDDDRTEEYKALIERIRGLREGAFRPLAEQPIVKALLLPFGGGAGLLLLDYLNILK